MYRSTVMACELKLLVIWLLISIVANYLQPLVHAQPQVPCYFVLGDSLFDNGNNNNLQTSIKANYPPYGVDFPSGPTGRFCNGRNMADQIGRRLGFDDSPPPFATARGQDILKGVNYASGGAGIRDETGRQLGSVISLNRQLVNLQTTVSNITAFLGSKEATDDYLKRCIFVVGTGNNDYLNNYLLPQYYNTSSIFNPDQYAAALIRQYSDQLRTLYGLGARKVAIFGIFQVGCTPTRRAQSGSNGSLCVDSDNSDVQLFNNRLKPLVDELNSNLTGAQFIYINSSGYQYISIPPLVDIPITSPPCCKLASSGVVKEFLCEPNQVPCNLRNTYIFFDGAHPTEILNAYIATRAYTPLTPHDAYPFGIRQLAQQ
ncbi:Triacylglycerol lipase [Bertholletia excelsa]